MNGNLRVLLLITISFVGYGCDAIPKTTEVAAAKCAEQGIYDTIKNIVFNSAIANNSGDPLSINDWSKSFTATVELPLMESFNSQVSKTDCSGRLVLTIPQSEQSKFGGEANLRADIAYNIQPSADGGGDVIKVSGFDFISAKIVAANAKLATDKIRQEIETENSAAQTRAEMVASIGGPQIVKTYNPSVDCARNLNNVERMICQSESLAAQDRDLSANFKLKIQAYDGAQKQQLLELQRQNLARRASCATTECVENWYYENADWVNTIN